MLEWKRLGEVANLVRGKVISKDYIRDHAGEYPVFSSQTANEGVFGCIDSYMFDGDYLTWTTDGAYAGTIFRRSGKFNITNVCGLIDITDENVNQDYLYYWLSIVAKSYVVEGMGNPKLMSNVASTIQIPVPSIAEQHRIVGILDTFTAAIDNLKQQIEQRRKQYEYYRDQLLDLEGKEGVEMKLRDFCLLKAGKSVSANEITDDSDGNYPCYGGNGIRGYVSCFSHEGDYPIIGRQGALCGCVCWANNKFYATEHAVVATGKDFMSQRFLFHMFQYANLNQYKTQGAQPGLSVSKLNEVVFKIPSLADQSRIVGILDTFEVSIANLEQQLEMRQKQYEYYRNQLLTFE
ncbi:MAG: restriction endonuclease subunit S [Bacteroidales bacterium]|nr:restriction endonuclease subunit S [Bacteroidales bacterium]